MGWFSSVSDMLGRVIDRIFPDKSKCREQQATLNNVELQGAPPSRLRLWRSFLGWTLSLLFVWETTGRAIVATYWPDVLLPPSTLEVVIQMLLLMLGGAF
jgi:hypothetical protein